jgi:hypothetical protein
MHLDDTDYAHSNDDSLQQHEALRVDRRTVAEVGVGGIAEELALILWVVVVTIQQP